MYKKIVLAFFMAFAALFSLVQAALAHESITAGNYEIEVGWLNEPPVVGQMNGIILHVTDTSTDEAVEDISTLTATLSYGGQTKDLDFEPLDEDEPGQFSAAVVPGVAGQYTLQVGGEIGNTPVDAEVNPEEVVPADNLFFPKVETTDAAPPQVGAMVWLNWLALLLSLVAIILGVMALRKSS